MVETRNTAKGLIGRFLSSRALAMTLLVIALVAGALAPSMVTAKAKRERNLGDHQAAVALLEHAEAKLAKSGRNGVSGQIVGGKPVKGSAFNFMAKVFIEDDNGDEFSCGGSLIDPTHVLTAAHCVADSGGPFAVGFALVLGLNDWTKWESCEATCVRFVDEYVVHPQYDAFSNKNDAAVLTLSESVDAQTSKPIELLGSGNTQFDVAGQPTIITGWGDTKEGANKGSLKLRQTTVKVVDDEKCQIQYEGDIDTATML